MRLAGALCITAVLALPTLAAAGDPVRAVRAEILHTMGPAGTLVDAVVVIEGNRVTQVGPASQVTLPDDVQPLRASVVTPGFVDAQSVVGLSGAYNVPADQDADERTGPNQAGLRALDGFNPHEMLLDWLLAHGVTTVQTGPGEANPIAGLAGVFKTYGDSADAMIVRFPSALIFNLGEPPKRTYAKERKPPLTRMGTAALIRQALLEARQYHAQRSGEARGIRFFSRKEEAPARDLGKEALGLVLSGEIPAIFTARREDDIETALRIGNEFGLSIQLADAVEAYLMRERIRQAGVPVLLGPVMERPASIETINHTFESAALLHNASIPIAFRSGFEGYVPKVRVVLFEASVAVANGLSDAAALRALTIESARLLGVDNRLGSLEPGKDADLVLFDGDPFEYTSHVEAVVVSGELAYQRGE